MTDSAEQRTEAWRRDRAGCITASNFAAAIKVMDAGVYKTGPKKGEPKPRNAECTKLMRQLAFERITGEPVHEINGQALAWGRDAEPYAFEAYEIETGHIVEQVGFIKHLNYDFIGCSPDGLIGDGGGLEMKNPRDEAVHIGTWLDGMPEDHIPQVQGGMLVTGRKWWNFVSYDARQAEPFRLYIQRIERDDDYINGVLLPGLLQFEAELRAMVKDLENRAMKHAA